MNKKILIGLAVFSLFVLQHITLRLIDRTRFHSSVSAPVHSIISSINQDLEDDRILIAEQKLKLFETKMNDFLINNGESPEKFHRDIISIVDSVKKVPDKSEAEK